MLTLTSIPHLNFLTLHYTNSANQAMWLNFRAQLPDLEELTLISEYSSNIAKIINFVDLPYLVMLALLDWRLSDSYFLWVSLALGLTEEGPTNFVAFVTSSKRRPRFPSIKGLTGLALR